VALGTLHLLAPQLEAPDLGREGAVE
jgi:hypothetical protein